MIWAVLKLETHLHQDVFVWNEKIRRYRAGFCRCRILLMLLPRAAQSTHSSSLGLGASLSQYPVILGAAPSPQSHTMIHFYTNSSCANDSNVIVSTGCKIGSLGLIQGFAAIYNATTFVSLSHCSEAKIFQQFHKTTAPLQAQCNEKHSWAFLGKLTETEQKFECSSREIKA